MKIIKSLKDIATLEVGDVVIFGDLQYKVCLDNGYFLSTPDVKNDKIFTILNISKRDFVKNLGINTLPITWDFPEVCSLEALTAIVAALFKEYEKQNELPKTWEEFCERYPTQNGEYYINNRSYIEALRGEDERVDNFDRNICTSKQEAEAFLALMQLRQLRKAYVKDWEPDWKNDISAKYCIEVDSNELLIHSWYNKSHTLSFPTCGLAEQFLTNFKDLLEIAKPLL
jgi:hypothetical protein